MKKSRTERPRLLLRKERIRILVQTDFKVVDGGEGSTFSVDTQLLTGPGPSRPTTCE